jgi:DNA repair exonuclease SbcCD ATPase subunit
MTTAQKPEPSPGPSATSANGASSGSEHPENLDTVRDILFGGHMRSVEGRIARIEERLAREQAEMRTSIDKSLGTLEAFARSEIDALNERLRAERAQRTDELKALESSIRDTLKNLDKRLAQLDEATSTADADLRSQVLERQREAAANLKAATDTLAAELRLTERTLRAEKADISSLLSIFSNVAVKLSEEMPPAQES